MKDIPALRYALCDTALFSSPLWSRPLDTLQPIHVLAFQTRLRLDGQRSEGFRLVDLMLSYIAREVTQNRAPIRCPALSMAGLRENEVA
jgi:hypothetical protein